MPKRKIKAQEKKRVQAVQKKSQPDAELKEIKSGLDSLRKEGKSFKGDLSKINKKITKLAKVITPPKRSQLDLLGEIEDDLNKKYTVIKNMKHDLLEAQKKIDNTDKIFKAKDDRIEELSVTVSRIKRINADQRKYLIDLEESDQAKDKVIEKLKKEIESRRGTSAAVVEESRETDGVISAKDEEIARLKGRITELNEETGEAGAKKFDGLIVEKTQEITRLKEAAADLENSNQTKERERRELKEEIFDLQMNIASLEESLKEGESASEKDEEIVRLKADVSWLKELNDTLKTQRRIVFVDKKE